MWKSTSICWNRIDMLESNEEEASDFYFILKMPARTTRIVINLPDTNVFTLALSKSFSIDANLYFLTGVNNKRKIIETEAVVDKAYQSTWKAVKSLRSLTHLWDSVSAFAGRGKTKPFVLMCKRPDHIKAFSNLGKYEKLPDQCLRR